jgi:hypothetical protein
VHALAPGTSGSGGADGGDQDPALSLAMELSMAQASGSGGRATSAAAVAALPRFAVEDDRCSALHEVVLEVAVLAHASDSGGSRSDSDNASSSSSTRTITSSSGDALPPQPPLSQRYYFETQVAAFSALPPPERPASSSLPSPPSPPSPPLLPLPSAPLVWGVPEEGHLPFANADALSGSVVLLRRGGGATFAAKALRAQAAGAVAVVRVPFAGATCACFLVFAHCACEPIL